MQVVADRGQLADALSICCPIIPAKTTKPILHNLLLVGRADGLDILATDLEVSASVHVEACKVQNPASAAVPAKQLRSLIGEFTDPTVTLTFRDQRCEVTSGGGKFLLLCDDAAAYPDAIGKPDAKPFRVLAPEFARLVRHTAFAAAREESRYAINGVLLELGDEKLRLVATDGRRLAIAETSADGVSGGCKAVLPIRALKAFTACIEDDAELEAQISVGERMASLSYGRVSVGTMLLESQFPDWDAVVPTSHDSKVIAPRALLMANLRRAAILCASDVQVVHLGHNGAGTLDMSAESDVGRADVSMDATHEGADLRVAFRPEYLLEALRASEADVITLLATESDRPVLFDLGMGTRYVLMPIAES